MSLVTIQEVRDISGAPITLIPDAQVQSIIDETELKLQEVYGIKFTPTKTIEILTGNWKDRIVVDEYFPLTVYELRNQDTVMTIKDNIFVHTNEGMLEIYGDTIVGEYSSRFSGWDIQVKVKYLYGAVEKNTGTSTETAAAVSSGSAINFEVDSSIGFTVGDYVFIEDLNRKAEVAKITVIPDSTHITVETLVNDYEINAMVTLSRTMEIFRQLSLIESSLSVMIYAIGSTYTIATGYTYPEYSVQKGVPYTHWLNAHDRAIKMRNELLPRIKSLMGAII